MKITALRITNIIILAFISAVFFTGCATTNAANQAKPVIVQSAPNVAEGGENNELAEPLPEPQLSAVQRFANRVEWPEVPSACGVMGQTSAFNIESGVDDGVWVEGKGYFRGTLDDVYRDLTDEKIIGPTHMTQDIERDEFVETPDKTSFVMHIKIKYGLTIKFDLSAELIPLYSQYEKSGLLYHSEKTSGTTFIKVISETILIEQLENGLFSVEFISINVATQDKLDEARQHLEKLFGHWKEASETRCPAKDVEEKSDAVAEPGDGGTEPADSGAEPSDVGAGTSES